VHTDGDERGQWRRQAIAWLQADLAAIEEVHRGGDEESRAAALETLEDWKDDPDLAAIREEAALGSVPPEERAQCRDLWNAVEALFQGTRS
jgi:hypothetical protein